MPIHLKIFLLLFSTLVLANHFGGKPQPTERSPGNPPVDLKQEAERIANKDCLFGNGGRRDIAVGRSNCLALREAIKAHQGIETKCNGKKSDVGGPQQDMQYAVPCDVYLAVLKKEKCDQFSDNKQLQCKGLTQGIMKHACEDLENKIQKVACLSIHRAIEKNCSKDLDDVPQAICQGFYRLPNDKKTGLDISSYFKTVFPAL